MKNKLTTLLLLQLCFITTISCNQAAEKYTQSVEEKVERAEKSAEKSSWLQELIATEAHTEEELLSKFPKQLTGLPLRSSASPAAQTAAGSYSTSPETSHETQHITLKIVDGAGNYGFGHVNAIHKMISMNVNNQETNNWAKTLEHKGVRILLKEEFNKGVQFSELQYIKDNRYHITLTGRRFNSDKLLEAMTELEKIKF